MKYKLKLDYTADELKELKELSKVCASPMTAVWLVVDSENDDDMFIKLQAKYNAIEHEDEFNFMADINNVVMGTAIFPEKEYVVHDKVTDQYIYYSIKRIGLFWGQSGAKIPYKNTKKWWLSINPAYEPMLVEADNEEY
ncbi:hypothetical protein FC72_GL000518 [Companilactobacillus tucceti DSM 20183]|uniref:Uncharacterized protein n=1 Tax=Companilactobacillus tucceti DSM 20183 TaxID=1423811 RepID=A0A0R1IZH6_9LACO|nr:hypothetical protein [Companilactobacillus tucceti]KRK64348.1 hypothetical protein FC72_GL000518 [Companilactobacillus tucceti DSM 20183]